MVVTGMIIAIVGISAAAVGIVSLDIFLSHQEHKKVKRKLEQGKSDKDTRFPYNPHLLHVYPYFY